MTTLLEIITPTKLILREEVEEVIVPTLDGEIAILPNHIKLLTMITNGELIVKKNSKSTSYAITGGFLEVENNIVKILADYAIRADDIELAKVQEAHERAKKLMEERRGKENFAFAESELKRSLLELKLAKKYKPKLSNKFTS